MDRLKDGSTHHSEPQDDTEQVRAKHTISHGTKYHPLEDEDSVPLADKGEGFATWTKPPVFGSSN